MENAEKIEMSKRFTGITITDKDNSIIEDTYLLAALITFNPGIVYSPVRDDNGRVSFMVRGKIAEDMGRFFSGDVASLQTYVKNLKELRSVIFAMKSGQRRRLR